MEKDCKSPEVGDDSQMWAQSANGRQADFSFVVTEDTSYSVIRFAQKQRIQTLHQKKGRKSRDLAWGVLSDQLRIPISRDSSAWECEQAALGGDPAEASICWSIRSSCITLDI